MVPPFFYNRSPVLCQGFTAPQPRRKSNCVVISHRHIGRHVAEAPAEKTPAAPKEPAITFNSVHVDGPYIAMTFDDGPSAVLTPKLLDILAAHHMKATFFVIGENVAE